MDTINRIGLFKDGEGRQCHECGGRPFILTGELQQIAGILSAILQELAKNSTEISESARGLPRHISEMSGAEAEDLGGILSLREGQGYGL